MEEGNSKSKSGTPGFNLCNTGVPSCRELERGWRGQAAGNETSAETERDGLWRHQGPLGKGAGKAASARPAQT